MHNLIRILVFAKDSESALDAAHKVVHEKLKTKIDGGPFDYYVDFTESPRKDPYMIADEAFASMLNDNGLSVVSRFGKTRYGPIPAVLQVSTARFPADDKRGMEMVNSAMEDNRTSFKRNMTEIRYLIANYTDDQLFVGTHPKGKVFIEIEGVRIQNQPALFREDLRYACGYFKGPDCWLYDFRGQPVISFSYLQKILNDTDSDPFYIDESGGQDPDWGRHIWNQPLWIVPFDVHY